MTEAPTPKNDGRSSASHEYTKVNTGEEPEISRKKDPEEKWPAEPPRLKDFTTFTCIELFWDVLVMLIPVAFLGEFVLSFIIGCFHDYFSFNLFYSIHSTSANFTTLISSKTPCVLVSTTRMHFNKVTFFQLMTLADPVFD